MCISNNVYQQPRVDFKDTVLYGAEVQTPGGVRHVLGYYNKVAAPPAAAQILTDFGWDMKPGNGDDFGWDIAPPAKKQGNAMLFAVPAVPGTMGKDSLIPVSRFPHFMQDYKRAVAPKPPMMRGAHSYSLTTSSSEPVVVKGFDNGTYDVVIASGGASTIKQVIAKVDPEKRPAINDELYAELDLVYPGFTFVLFCFQEAKAEQAGCALMTYEPMFPHLLFLPGLDGHNGHIERGVVKLNHTLIVGSNTNNRARLGNEVEFTDEYLQVDTSPYLVNRVIGKIIPDGTAAPQGDFLFSVADVRNGVFRCRRQLPPGWARLPGAVPEVKPHYICDP